MARRSIHRSEAKPRPGIEISFQSSPSGQASRLAAIFLLGLLPFILFNMDFQNRAGGKTGSGGVASWSESNRDRRERLRQLALETIDLNKVKIAIAVPIVVCECALVFVSNN